MKYNKYINYTVIILSFLGLLYISWLRWGNLIVDTFRDPWVAYKITEGRVLYKDLHYIFGFLPPYFIAFLYKIFGVHLNCLIFTGIAITIATSIFIYKISRLFLNRPFSTLVVLNFLFVFAFGSYSYYGVFNFILPYTLSSTFFIMFILSGLFFFIKFIRKERLKELLCWDLSIYLAFLSRPSMCLYVWVAFILVGLLYVFRKKRYKTLTYFFLPFLLSLFSYWIFLLFNNAFSGFNESVISTLSFVSSGKAVYNLFMTGFYSFSINLIFTIKSFLFQLLAVSLLYFVSVIMALVIKRSKIKASNKLVFPLLGGVSFAVIFYLLKSMYYFNQYRLMPFLLIMGMIIYFFRLFSYKNVDSKKYLSLLTLFYISLVLILRVVLCVTPNNYTFFLLPSGLICYYVFFAELYPSVLRKLININGKMRNYYLFSLFVFFALLIFPFVKRNYAWYQKKTFGIPTVRGEIHSFADELSERFWQTISYLTKNTPEDATVVVFPEGVGINFFSFRDNPSRYYTFVPLETGAIGEDGIIYRLNLHKIDYVVLMYRVTAEYGYPVFGIHYGKKIYSWILENYELVKVIGPYPFTYREFGVAIFKKNRPNTASH